MKLTIELSEEEVRAAIVAKINNEASKHGHPDDATREISVVTPDGGTSPLDELKVNIVARIETR